VESEPLAERGRLTVFALSGRCQSTAGSALTEEGEIAAPQPDIDTSAWADRIDSKHRGIARRRHTNGSDDQTFEHRRFGRGGTDASSLI
jgi:hypothetical protein